MDMLVIQRNTSSKNEIYGWTYTSRLPKN